MHVNAVWQSLYVHAIENFCTLPTTTENFAPLWKGCGRVSLMSYTRFYEFYYGFTASHLIILIISWLHMSRFCRLSEACCNSMKPKTVQAPCKLVFRFFLLKLKFVEDIEFFVTALISTLTHIGRTCKETEWKKLYIWQSHEVAKGT